MQRSVRKRERGEREGTIWKGCLYNKVKKYLSFFCSVDVVTGGLEASGPSPLDSMTEEEKEKEAEKLHRLIKKLNK